MGSWPLGSRAGVAGDVSFFFPRPSSRCFLSSFVYTRGVPALRVSFLCPSIIFAVSFPLHFGFLLSSRPLPVSFPPRHGNNTAVNKPLQRCYAGDWSWSGVTSPDSTHLGGESPQPASPSQPSGPGGSWHYILLTLSLSLLRTVALNFLLLSALLAQIVLFATPTT
jgi:hypothetical protein